MFLLQAHAARQPWSWLIFDVGRKMKLPIFLLCFLCGCASRTDWGDPITFVGRPESIRDGSYQTVDGRERSYVVSVLQVKKGEYDKKEISFGFREGSEPPLEIGRLYLFTLQFDRHGGHYTQVKKLE
jgi:hypothetical protein